MMQLDRVLFFLVLCFLFSFCGLMHITIIVVVIGIINDRWIWTGY